MKLRDALESSGFPAQVSDHLTRYITELYPPQIAAVNKGVLAGKSLLLSVPTAAGKTLIAELAMLRSIILNGGRCLYIAPLKALASEKYNDFKEKFSPLGIKVGISIGDASSYESAEKQLGTHNIIVATAEKIDSLLRSRSSWLINGLNVVVLDEIHFINDANRGPTLEILTARIKQLNPDVQIIALSATVKNAQEIAGWLNAELVTSSWRPIPLKEGVYFQRKIIFDHDGTRLVAEDESEDLNNLTLDTLRGQGQVLIFVNSRRSAQAVSRQICKTVSKILTPEEKKNLQDLSKKIVGSATEATKICRQLGDVIAHGAAFHHAGLKSNQRELIETHFKNNLIKVISCTPTLAAGVNLPARRAIIRDCKRFESGLGQAYIPTSEYKQCAGRAGRPQYDKYGEAVLMAKTASETQTLFDKYIRADVEPVTSKLSNETALRIHVLASIAGGYIHDVNGMFEFLSHTFFYHQNRSHNMIDTIGRIFEFLQRENFIEKSGYRFFATTFGSLTSRLYIDPLTAMTLRDALKLSENKGGLTALGALHMICCCPDNPILKLGQKDIPDVEEFASHFRDEFILTPNNCGYLEDLYTHTATIKTSWLLLHWIEEEREETICEQFNVGPGDLYRYIESAQWLIYAAVSIAELMMKKKVTFELEEVRQRLRYGIKKELVDLAQLKGVGRVRARVLFQAGYPTIQELKFAPLEKLADLPNIGKSLAKDILDQAVNPPRLKRKAVSESNA
jgi:helicase